VYTIFKNESHIFKEWLDHYLSEGVNHFYLIDNGSTDNYKEIIEPYMKYITLFKDDETGNDTQMKIYKRHIFDKLSETEWIMCLDMDEFMYTKKGTLADELKSVKDKSIGQILVPWKYYGSSGHIKQPKNVVKSFLYRRKCPYNSPTKPIARSESIETLGIHGHKLKSEYKTVDSSYTIHTRHDITGYDDIDVTEKFIFKTNLQCNHYMVQSLEWFRNVKMTRGSTNFSSNHRNEEYFKEWDYNVILDDELSFKKYNPIIPILLFFLLHIVLGFNVVLYIITFMSVYVD
jgi:hypothetical protein